MGAPCQSFAPKSGWRGLAEPIELTYRSELGSTGRRSIDVFQTLSGGNTGQPMVSGRGSGGAAQEQKEKAARTMKSIAARRGWIFIRNRNYARRVVIRRRRSRADVTGLTQGGVHDALDVKDVA